MLQSVLVRAPLVPRPGTVADLFEAYATHLKLSGKTSWKDAEKGLNKIADRLGRHRPARDIEPDEITNAIRPIYDRGKRSMAECTNIARNASR